MLIREVGSNPSRGRSVGTLKFSTGQIPTFYLLISPRIASYTLSNHCIKVDHMVSKVIKNNFS